MRVGKDSEENGDNEEGFRRGPEGRRWVEAVDGGM